MHFIIYNMYRFYCGDFIYVMNFIYGIKYPHLLKELSSCKQLFKIYFGIKCDKDEIQV